MWFLDVAGQVVLEHDAATGVARCTGADEVQIRELEAAVVVGLERIARACVIVARPVPYEPTVIGLLAVPALAGAI